jgi:hypothetical protein
VVRAAGQEARRVAGPLARCRTGVQWPLERICVLVSYALFSFDAYTACRRVQNAFLLKKESGRIQFSKEAYNLTNQNSFKYSGIANSKAADISGADHGIVLGIKSQKGKTSPVRSCTRVTPGEPGAVGRQHWSSTGGMSDLSAGILVRCVPWELSRGLQVADE